MSNNKEFCIIDIANQFESRGRKQAILPIVTEDNNYGLHLLIAKAEINNTILEGTYHIGFMYPESTQFKSWENIEMDVNFPLRRALHINGSSNYQDHDSAVFTVSNHQSLIDMIELCKNVIDSQSIGGYIPLDAGNLFTEHYNSGQAPFLQSVNIRPSIYN